MPADLPTSFRLDAETRRLLDALAERLGLERVQILRLAIRELARKQKVS